MAIASLGVTLSQVSLGHQADWKEGGDKRIEHAEESLDLAEVEERRRQRPVAAEVSEAEDVHRRRKKGVKHAP